MKLYLAGVKSLRALFNKKGLDFSSFIQKEKPYILESYFYADEYTADVAKNAGDFLLDSGAFTFQSSQKGKDVDWVAYIKRYADFINKNNIDKFFELDIDYVVGCEKVKEYRKLLISLTGKNPIPVWHKIRGVPEFSAMCEEYDYVAIGASGRNEDSKWLRSNPKAVKYFVKTAHKYHSKIHGLGYTDLATLPFMRFDSVDSTTWLVSNRYGEYSKFNGTTMEKFRTPSDKRLVNPDDMDVSNFMEWLKFQRYAEVNL